jgi:beta-galactosidase/beta-glucuronidase
MWYRLIFDAARTSKNGNGKTLLHFGAIDWQSQIYLNGKLLMNHTGGYDGFDIDVTSGMKASGNELLVYAFDPSDTGAQPNGKQRISAIDNPGGDTYTPSSGIWQTVWLEAVPAAYVASLTINQHSETAVVVSADVPGETGDVSFTVMDKSGKTVGTGSGKSGANVTITVAGAQTWSPDSPYLYDMKVAAASGDSVAAYFGLRTFVLGDTPDKKGKRPLLNGKFTFLAGFLDQVRRCIYIALDPRPC